MTERRETQPERTRLAWRRTVLAATVAGLLLVRLAGLGPLAVAVAVPLAVAGWLTLLVLAQRRIGRLAVPRPDPLGRAPVVAAATVAGYAVLGVLLVVLHTG